MSRGGAEAQRRSTRRLKSKADVARRRRGAEKNHKKVKVEGRCRAEAQGRREEAQEG